MRKQLALVAAVLFSCGLWACNAATDIAELDTALHQSYGALSEADEDTDFGDADLASAADLNGEEDLEVNDTQADEDANLAAVENDGNQRAQRLLIAIMWGHLQPQPEQREVTDWSGSIVAHNAALRIRRSLRFEIGDGLQARPNIREVPFVSHTAPHADGLLLEVILHPALIQREGEPVSISLQSAAFSDTLILQPGMRLSRVVRVDDSGNAVAYHIFRPSNGNCQEGLLAGRYTDKFTTDDGRELGVIKGKYLAFDGSLAGKIKGIYGERDNGQKLFFAKVIKRDGSFQGTLAGRYGEGKLKGRYLGKKRTVVGVMQGMYREASEDQGGGFFMGRWSVGCGELSREGQAESADDDNNDVESEISDAM